MSSLAGRQSCVINAKLVFFYAQLLLCETQKTLEREFVKDRYLTIIPGICVSVCREPGSV